MQIKYDLPLSLPGLQKKVRVVSIVAALAKLVDVGLLYK